MKTILIAGAATAFALTLGSCATMSEDQCLAGDWGGQGYRDGAEGLPMSRLADHAEACAKYQVTPNEAAYASARADGLTQYCTRERGFREGREGDSYYGVCPASAEAEFLPAYQDGQQVHEAQSAADSARSSVSSLGSRLEELDEKISGKQAEMRQDGLTEEQREAIRDRIQEIRRERADTERNWRRAQDELDDAEERARRVRWRFERTYGSW